MRPLPDGPPENRPAPRRRHGVFYKLTLIAAICDMNDSAEPGVEAGPVAPQLKATVSEAERVATACSAIVSGSSPTE